MTYRTELALAVGALSRGVVFSDGSQKHSRHAIKRQGAIISATDAEKMVPLGIRATAAFSQAGFDDTPPDDENLDIASCDLGFMTAACGASAVVPPPASKGHLDDRA